MAGDVLLVAVATWLVLRPGPRLDLWHDLLVSACVALGAALTVMPFLLEHRARLRLAEAAGLAATVDQIKGLTAVGEQIATATACWQAVQEAAGKTAQDARQMADDITREARQFSDAMKKAHDAEVRSLRLEVEKLHHAQGDWLQVLVRIMDHIYALYSAGVRSGQPQLTAELGHFQEACRDALRRVGLTPIEALPNDLYDERLHELAPGAAASPEARVAQTLATGFTYQGQLLRRALVALAPIDAPQPVPQATQIAAPEAPPSASADTPSSPASPKSNDPQLAFGDLHPAAPEA